MSQSSLEILSVRQTKQKDELDIQTKNFSVVLNKQAQNSKKIQLKISQPVSLQSSVANLQGYYLNQLQARHSSIPKDQNAQTKLNKSNLQTITIKAPRAIQGAQKLINAY